MKKIVKKEWCELLPLWNDLYDNNINTTPFQSYEFLTFTGKGKPFRKDLFRLFGLKELNLVLYVNNEVVAIAPLLIKSNRKKTKVYFRGHFTTANQLDFIYKNWRYEDFEFLMNGIRSMLSNASFVLDRVSEKTVTCIYLKEYMSSKQIKEHECFSIPIPESYDEWHKSLRKSVRRNLTTHNNRIIKDQINCSTDFFCGQTIDNKTCKKMMGVYADRFIVKNSFYFGPFTKVIKGLLTIFLLRDKVTQWLSRVDKNFHVIVYMDKEIAALGSGVICKDKRIILSRLAIFTKYSKYGPGGILISSAIKYLIEQNKCGDFDIDELDLSQEGDGGNSYKIKYGGLVHHNYTFID